MKKKSKFVLKRRHKTKIKLGANVILGSLIFFFLFGYAFNVSFLFGLFFFIGFLWETSSGRLKKQPFLALLLLAGSLVTRIGLEQFFPKIMNSGTLLDSLVALALFTAIFFIGYKIKKH